MSGMRGDIDAQILGAIEHHREREKALGELTRLTGERASCWAAAIRWVAASEREKQRRFLERHARSAR